MGPKVSECIYDLLTRYQYGQPLNREEVDRVIRYLEQKKRTWEAIYGRKTDRR